MKKRTKQGLALIKVQMMTALLILCANPLAAEEQKLGEGLKLKDIWDSFDVLTLQKKADQGDAGAQNNLGVRYKDGRGVEQNDEKTVYWFREAVKKRNAAAQNNLGWMYSEGRGVEQNYETAVSWFHKAAEQGDAATQNNLGWMYKQGRGVEQSNETAVYWYRKAAEQGFAEAEFFLGDRYYVGEEEYRRSTVLAYKSS